MDFVLLTAVVTAVWVLAGGFVGVFLLAPKGRPYKAWRLVIHIILVIPIAAGWVFTVQGLSNVSGNQVGSLIAEIVMGLAVVSLLVSGPILAAGKEVPAPRGFVLAHQIGMAVALLGSFAGIVCIFFRV